MRLMLFQNLQQVYTHVYVPGIYSRVCSDWFLPALLIIQCFERLPGYRAGQKGQDPNQSTVLELHSKPQSFIHLVPSPPRNGTPQGQVMCVKVFCKL